MTAILGIDHVQLVMPAGREAEASAFYSGLLGIPEVAKPPEVERLREPRVDVVEAPTEGSFRVYVGDPFGNRIELMERVGP